MSWNDEISESLRQSYKYCEKVTRRHARSFYFAAKFLPKDKRPSIYALYALCRHIDDEVDETNIKDARAAAQAVEVWKSVVSGQWRESGAVSGRWSEVGETKDKEQRTKGEGQPTNPQSAIRNPQSIGLLFRAWRDTLAKYKIPRELPLELIEGVLMDTHINRYETFDELYVYCYRVASTVGLMSSEIMGYEDPRTLEYAEALGIGMQLTNILRDLGEDAEMGRIYLPQEDLRRFNVREEQLFEGKVDENFAKLMEFEIKRARTFYRKAEQGIPFLEKRTRFAVLLASRIYGRILAEIERQRYDVFSKRAHTTASQKVLSIPQIWFEARNLKLL